MTGYIIAVIIAVVAVVAVVVMWRREVSRLSEDVAQRDALLRSKDEEHAQLSRSHACELAQLNQSLTDERVAHARTASERDAIKQTFEQAQRDRAESESNMKNEFKSLANEILAEHQHNLRQTNRDSIDLLLKPFKDNITE